MARKSRTKPIRSVDTGAPTPERLRHAGDAFEIGNDGQGQRKITILSPLERLFRRDGIDPKAYYALKKFHIHWANAGLTPHFGSMDLNRIAAGDGSNFPGAPATDRHVFHRQQYAKGVQEIGVISSVVVQKFVFEDEPLEIVGNILGYSSPSRGREAAQQLVIDAGAKLAKIWGM